MHVKTSRLFASVSDESSRSRSAAVPVSGPVATIRVDTTHVIKSFDPDVALGTSIDILPQGVVDKVYSPAILKESG